MSRADSGFARVYAEHVFRVYGFLAYRVHDHELAEDLTQGTFERALRSWAKFDPRRASERTWLLAIANNLLIDHYRRERVMHDAKARALCRSARKRDPKALVPGRIIDRDARSLCNRPQCSASMRRDLVPISS